MKAAPAAGLLLTVLAAAGSARGARAQETAQILVANLSGGHVARFDARSGRHEGTLVPAGSGGLALGTGITVGPDGLLYVASSGSDAVLRFDPATGAFVDTFAGAPALTRPFSLAFDREGHLHVSSGNRVLRFAPDGTPEGAVVEVGLETPIGLRFAPDGSLWIANAGAHAVLRVDPETGSPLGAPLTAEPLRFPSDLVFARDGRLLVSSAFAGAVVAFDPESGEFLGHVVELPDGSVPVGLALDPDGRLLIADFGASRLWRFALPEGPLELLSEEGLDQPENLVVAVIER